MITKPEKLKDLTIITSLKNSTVKLNFSGGKKSDSLRYEIGLSKAEAIKTVHHILNSVWKLELDHDKDPNNIQPPKRKEHAKN